MADSFQTITIGRSELRHLRVNRMGEVMALCEVVRDDGHRGPNTDGDQRAESARNDAGPGTITCQRCRTALDLNLRR